MQGFDGKGTGPNKDAKSLLSGHRFYGNSIIAEAGDSLKRKVTQFPNVSLVSLSVSQYPERILIQYCLSTEDLTHT